MGVLAIVRVLFRCYFAITYLVLFQAGKKNFKIIFLKEQEAEVYETRKIRR